MLMLTYWKAFFSPQIKYRAPFLPLVYIYTRNINTLNIREQTLHIKCTHQAINASLVTSQVRSTLLQTMLSVASKSAILFRATTSSKPIYIKVYMQPDLKQVCSEVSTMKLTFRSVCLVRIRITLPK